VDDTVWLDLEPTDPAGEPGESLLRAEARAALDTALDALTEPQRRVLLLRYYGNLAFEEIASVLDCPLNTALSHCRRGLLALRQLMTGHEQK
jgi:RNA polymerase sigma-70 factor (ECF subfamily)